MKRRSFLKGLGALFAAAVAPVLALKKTVYRAFGDKRGYVGGNMIWPGANIENSWMSIIEDPEKDAPSDKTEELY